MLKTADWGRKSNETIATAYSPEWLDVFARMSQAMANNNDDLALSLVW